MSSAPLVRYTVENTGRGPAANVLKEIEYLVDIYAIRHLEIEDDNFTLNKERTVKILEGLIALNERGAGLSWSTPNGVRIDTLDEQIIKLIKQSNCSSITLALEHGDQEMLKIMNKKLNLETAYNVIKMLVKHGIPQIGLFVIVGYPGETRERFNNSLTYLKKLRKLGKHVTICVNNAQPYPGTRLTKRCFSEGIIKDKDFGNFLVRKNLMSTGHFISITTPDFDTKEVIRRRGQVADVFSPIWKVLVKKMMPLYFMKKLNNLRRSFNFC